MLSYIAKYAKSANYLASCPPTQVPSLPHEAVEHRPLGRLDHVPRNPRNPVTYPSLTWDEIDGTRYPGEGVDLGQFCEYERMTCLCQCFSARLVTMEYNNSRKGHEFLVRQLAEVDGLRLMASDFRPGYLLKNVYVVVVDLGTILNYATMDMQSLLVAMWMRP